MRNRSHELSVTRQAELLNISRGTVYYLPRPVSGLGDGYHLYHDEQRVCLSDRRD